VADGRCARRAAAGVLEGVAGAAAAGDFVVFSSDPNVIQVIDIANESAKRLSGHTKLADGVFFGRAAEGIIVSVSVIERCCKSWEVRAGA
jgi:hypothetical protein